MIAYQNEYTSILHSKTHYLAIETNENIFFVHIIVYYRDINIPSFCFRAAFAKEILSIIQFVISVKLISDDCSCFYYF